MTIKTLDQVGQSKILDCFNLAFSDYLVTIQLSAEQFKNKLKSENVDLSYSVGAFREEKLVGFILHGVKETDHSRLVYNGGTGVIPVERGQGLTVKMYDFIIPLLKTKLVNGIILEVISNNQPAIKSYKKIGFKSVRDLNCYKGTIINTEINPDIKIQDIKNPDWDSLCQLGEVKPTWQNSLEAIKNSGSSIRCLGAYEKENVRGYLVINTSNNRIIQIAVDKNVRNKKIGSTFLAHLKRNGIDPASMINVDASQESINKFLEASGLDNILQQQEMKLELN